MALLEVGLDRENITTIYRPNLTFSVLEQQFALLDDQLDQAIQNGNLSFSIREPTQTLKAALVVTITQYEKRADKAFNTLNKLARNIGKGINNVAFDWGNNQILLDIEENVPSAHSSQTSYTVADLPA